MKQFIHLTYEGLTHDYRAEIKSIYAANKIRLTSEFTGSKQAQEHALKLYDKIFGKSKGTQRLSLIVAGETIKYHGGNYGVEKSSNGGPILYIELPAMRVLNDD